MTRGSWYLIRLLCFFSPLSRLRFLRLAVVILEPKYLAWRLQSVRSLESSAHFWSLICLHSIQHTSSLPCAAMGDNNRNAAHSISTIAVVIVEFALSRFLPNNVHCSVPELCHCLLLICTTIHDRDWLTRANQVLLWRLSSFYILRDSISIDFSHSRSMIWFSRFCPCTHKCMFDADLKIDSSEDNLTTDADAQNVLSFVGPRQIKTSIIRSSNLSQELLLFGHSPLFRFSILCAQIKF